MNLILKSLKRSYTVARIRKEDPSLGFALPRYVFVWDHTHP